MRCLSKRDCLVDWLSRIFVALGVCTMLLASSHWVRAQTYTYPLWTSTFKNASAYCDPSSLLCNDCSGSQTTWCVNGSGPGGAYEMSYCLPTLLSTCTGTTFDCGDAYTCSDYPTGNPCPNSTFCF
jgi:hypothetical protein